jgi:putative transposase
MYDHFVFAVKGRQSLIPVAHRDELYKYIAGIIRNRKQKLLAIGGMPDHVHLLVNVKPDIAASDLVRDIKAVSSKFMNERQWFPAPFHWQDGFGSFTYSYSQVHDVATYIERQMEHHKRYSFKDEFLAILKQFNIPFDERYLFEWIE